MGLQGLGADGWRHLPKNLGRTQTSASDSQEAAIYAAIDSHSSRERRRSSYATRAEGGSLEGGGRRIQISPARSRRTSSLPAVIGYHCLPPRRVGTFRRFNSRDNAL